MQEALLKSNVKNSLDYLLNVPKIDGVFVIMAKKFCELKMFTAVARLADFLSLCYEKLNQLKSSSL